MIAKPPRRAARTTADSILSRESIVWNALVAAAASVATRRGAAPEIVDEARARTDLPVHRRLFMIRWATDVTGSRALRRGFRPAQHLSTEAARGAAQQALAERIARTGDETAREQLIGLTSSDDLTELLVLIERDVRSRIADRAVTPKRGRGVDPATLTTIVANVTSLLERRGIQPFLMSGTLLGFIRDGTFLEHDHDVDLGILPSTGLDEVADALAAAGLRLSVELEDRWLVGVHDSGLHIDFFRHDLRNGHFWHATRVHEWWNTPFELTELRVGGHRWWIPDDAERYLDENYGDWSVPVAFYDISFDTPNRTYQPTADAARQLYLTCIRGLAAGDRWMVEASARELRDHFGVDVTANLAASRLLALGADPPPPRDWSARHPLQP